MKKLKKRFIVPAVVFILGMCALIGTIYVVGEGQDCLLYTSPSPRD